MKQLLLGNEAVARGLYEAGVRVVSSYPGTPSTEITEAAAKFEEIYCEWAPNEKVAAEVAAGASIAGARSFCAMKHVGLNVAADLLYTISYTGMNKIPVTMQLHLTFLCWNLPSLRNAVLLQSWLIHFQRSMILRLSSVFPPEFLTLAVL